MFAGVRKAGGTFAFWPGRKRARATGRTRHWDVGAVIQLVGVLKYIACSGSLAVMPAVHGAHRVADRIERRKLCDFASSSIAREVPGNRFDHVIRFAGLEEPGYDGVAKVVEAQAR